MQDNKIRTISRIATTLASTDVHGRCSASSNNSSQQLGLTRVFFVPIRPLAKTWTEVWGDEVGALAPKKNFFRPPPN